MTDTTTARERRIKLVEATEAYRKAIADIGYECSVNMGTMEYPYRSLVEIHVNQQREEQEEAP